MQNEPLRRKLPARPAIILSILLLTQAAVFYGFSRHENIPPYRKLDQFPSQLGTWRLVQEGVLAKEETDVLRADDYINRFYMKPGTPAYANLFVAFFKTQRAGQAPHSPKNCLPGSGWIWTVSDTIPVSIPAMESPIVVNRYVVQKGDDRALTLYWYQSRGRVIASEYTAKFFVVADALRYNRTDTSLVRVWVPIINRDDRTANDQAVNFVQSFFGTLKTFLPQ